MVQFSRRQALFSGVLGVASLSAPKIGVAKEEMPAKIQGNVGFYKYKIGDIEAAALFDGFALRPIDEKFVPNAPFADVQKALEQSFMNDNKLNIPFTMFYAKIAGKHVLIDAGTGGMITPTAGQMLSQLQAIGVTPNQIDVVVISHFHGDHISGLKDKEGQLVFKNAAILVPAPEWAYWMDEGEKSRAPEARKGNFALVEKIFGSVKGKVVPYKADEELLPGLRSIATHGHTPGHMSFLISSGKEQLIVLSDVTNHPGLFLKNPDWSPMFDMDAQMAVASRRSILDRISIDKIMVQGYHFPFPAAGHVYKDGNGYALVPLQWS